jgi:hypothetical protein
MLLFGEHALRGITNHDLRQKLARATYPLASSRKAAIYERKHYMLALLRSLLYPCSMKYHEAICLVGFCLGVAAASCGREGKLQDSGPRDTGTSDAGGAAIQVAIVSAVAQGTDLKIEWQSSKPVQNIWYPACGTAPRLLKVTSGGWSELPDDRPREGTMQPYYLDGVYVENRSLGCDGGNSCYESTGTTLSTLEYVQVGTRAPREPYNAVGSTGPSDAPVPDVVSRASTGPYQMELRYMIGSCPSSQIGVVRLDLP